MPTTPKSVPKGTRIKVFKGVYDGLERRSGVVRRSPERRKVNETQSSLNKYYDRRQTKWREFDEEKDKGRFSEQAIERAKKSSAEAVRILGEKYVPERHSVPMVFDIPINPPFKYQRVLREIYYDPFQKKFFWKSGQRLERRRRKGERRDREIIMQTMENPE